MCGYFFQSRCVFAIEYEFFNYLTVPIVFSAFEIENTEELDVKLYNPQKAPIAPEKLSQFLQQYKLCSFFHIAVVFPDGIMTGLSNLVILR